MKEYINNKLASLRNAIEKSATYKDTEIAGQAYQEARKIEQEIEDAFEKSQPSASLLERAEAYAKDVEKELKSRGYVLPTDISEVFRSIYISGSQSQREREEIDLAVTGIIMGAESMHEHYMKMLNQELKKRDMRDVGPMEANKYLVEELSVGEAIELISKQ